MIIKKSLEVLKAVEEAFKIHDRAVVQFSGGKDSIAVLELCRDYADRITVIYGDPGDSYPHVLKYVKALCQRWGYKLEFAKPEMSVQEYRVEQGYPVDILPVWAHLGAAQFLPEERQPQVLMQSGIQCCNAMLWQPVHKATLATGTKLVFRGSKGTDSHVTAPDGTVVEGVEYRCPLWNWTDEEVLEYLETVQVDLPIQYYTGCCHSLDCMRCTAWGDTQAERDRITFNRQYYPNEHAEWQDMMRAVRDETIRQLDKIQPFIDLAE